MIIWGVGLFVHYRIDPSSPFGEEWTSSSKLQLVGFVILITGQAIYGEIIRIPFLRHSQTNFCQKRFGRVEVTFGWGWRGFKKVLELTKETHLETLCISEFVVNQSKVRWLVKSHPHRNSSDSFSLGWWNEGWNRWMRFFWVRLDVLPHAISPDKPLAKATITSVKVRWLVKLLLWVFLQLFISNAKLSMQQVPFRQLRRCGDVYISLSILALCEPGFMNMWWWALYRCLESCWVVGMLSKTMVDAIVALQCLIYVKQEAHWSEWRDVWTNHPLQWKSNCMAVGWRKRVAVVWWWQVKLGVEMSRAKQPSIGVSIYGPLVMTSSFFGLQK